MAGPSILIAGGGLAGLSMAHHLMDQPGLDARITVLEGRERYEHDRNWCCWYPTSHPAMDCVTHAWDSWEIRSGPHRVVQGDRSLPYRRVPAGEFYRSTTDRLAAAGHRLTMGAQVDRVEEASGRARITRSDGSTLEADYAFDARPKPATGSPGRHRVDLVQHFTGWHLRAHEPCFHPGVVTLMDFLPSSTDVRFIYALPFSAHEALVESTGFSAAPEQDQIHESRIRDWLSDRHGITRFEILAKERGIIPMSSARPPQDRRTRIQRIGAHAGMIKPSTGYSFDAIQTGCEALAAQVAKGSPLQAPQLRSRLSRILDGVFLSLLRRQPERFPGLFMRLFEQVEPAALIRFLSDRACPRDLWRVIRAMPTTPMTTEALRAFPVWLRA